MRAAAFPIAWLGLLLAGPALGAGGGEGDLLHDLVFPWVNLLLLFAVLFFAARKPLRAFFADRRAHIQDDLASAAQLKSDAESRLSEWQGKLAELESEIAQLRDGARSRAEAEGQAILADAEATAERIRRDAQAAIDQELLRSRAALREEAADLAVELAGRVLEQQVSDGDRSRLVDEFIESVERVPKNGSRSTS